MLLSAATAYPRALPGMLLIPGASRWLTKDHVQGMVQVYAFHWQPKLETFPQRVNRMSLL